jgi:hypothetical protein
VICGGHVEDYSLADAYTDADADAGGSQNYGGPSFCRAAE